METDDALIFTKVVSSGSFSKAAELLNMPKSTLSRRISNLEERLGVRLLERTTRQLALTDIGRGYHGHCERIVEEIQEAESYIAQSQSEPQGTLKVSVAVDIALIHMQEIFADFLLEYPKISLVVDLSQRVVNLIEEEVDVAIRVRNLEDSSLIAKKIGVSTISLFSHVDYFANREIPTHPSQLIETDCIGLDAGNPVWEFWDGRQEIKVKPRHRYKVNNLTLIKTAVLKGLGIAILPQKSCEPHLGKELMPLLEDYSVRFGNIYAVYPSKKYMSSKLRVFLDYLEIHFQQNPSKDR